MKNRMPLLGSSLAAALVVFAVPGAAASSHECVSAKPTAESYKWNFKAEANTIFQDIRAQADEALDHANQLQSFERDPNLSEEAHAEQLEALKANVNDIGDRICRLETIRRVLAPWQRKEVDRIVMTTRLLADNTQDAILFVDAHPKELWMPTYQKYTNNLYDEAQSLASSVRDAVAYSNVSKEYRGLRHELGLRSSS